MPTRQRSRYTRRPRSKYLWVQDNVDTETTIVQNQQALTQIVSLVDVAVKANATVVRQIGTWSVRPGTNDTDYQMMFGVLMMSGDAFAAAALPEMQVDDISWLFVDQIQGREGDTGADKPFTTKNFDSHSKRRFRHTDQALVVMLENISNTAISLTFNWAIRTLLKVV